MEVANFANNLKKLQQMTAKDIFQKIRWSTELNKGSVYDVIQMVTGSAQKGLYEYWNRIQTQYPEVPTKTGNLKFPGKGQKETPCADAVTLVEIAYLCPGKAAAQFRRQGAELLCRALAGDLSLVDEIVKKHAEIDTDTQEKLLSGTSSTQEQANALPQAFKRITKNNVLFKQPVLYIGRYKEIGGPMTLKVGRSKEVRKRVIGGDQKGRMYWTHLVSMPNESMMRVYEKAIIGFAKDKDILAKANEYIDPNKLGRMLGRTEDWSVDEAAKGLMGLIAPTLQEGQQVYLVSHTESNILAPPSYEDAITQKDNAREYALVPEDYDWTESVRDLQCYKESVSSIEEWLDTMEKEEKKNAKDTEEIERIRLEREREVTKQECEVTRQEREDTKRKTLEVIVELTKLGKSDLAAKLIESLDLSSGCSSTERDIVASQEIVEATKTYERENDMFIQFIEEKCTATRNHAISTITLAESFIEWAKRQTGTTAFKHPKKYTSPLEQAFQKLAWNVEKKQDASGHMVFKNVSLND